MTNRVVGPCHSVLMSGEGLRPVIRFSRKHVCEVVRIDTSAERPGEYLVTFYWPDAQAQCLTRWMDWRVCLEWIFKRVRKGGSMACVHRVNIQLGDKTNEMAWNSQYRAALQDKGVQIVCPFDLALLNATR